MAKPHALPPAKGTCAQMMTQVSFLLSTTKEKDIKVTEEGMVFQRLCTFCCMCPVLKQSRRQCRFCCAEVQYPLPGIPPNSSSAREMSAQAVLDRDKETEVEASMPLLHTLVNNWLLTSNVTIYNRIFIMTNKFIKAMKVACMNSEILLQSSSRFRKLVMICQNMILIFILKYSRGFWVGYINFRCILHGHRIWNLNQNNCRMHM